MDIIPAGYRDLLTEESRAFAVLGTAGQDGVPVLAPIWFLVDDEHFLFFTGANSHKARRIAENPQVSLVIMTEGNHLRYMEVRGEVVGQTTEHITALRQRLWHKYTDHDPPAAEEDIVLYRVKPRQVHPFDYR